MNYRLATQDDLERVINFFQLVDNDFVPPLSKRFDIKKEIKSLFKHQEKFLLLEKKGRIIGVLSFSEDKNKKYALISYLVIHPAYRDKNLGRNLLEECFNLLIGDKIPKVIIQTWSTNQKALDLYSKKGFVIKKIVKDDRGPDLDTIILEEPLERIRINYKIDGDNKRAN